MRSTTISSVPAIIRTCESLLVLHALRSDRSARAHSYEDQNYFYCKLFNLSFPSSSVLHDSYQLKGTHLSSWTSADYPESYPDILSKYNIPTSCICTIPSNVSLHRNFLCSTKINSERASCYATGRKGFSSYIFLKYLDLANIYRK